MEYTFFLKAHEIFFNIDHKLGHKTGIIKLKMIEIIQAIDHNGKKSEITNNRNLETHIYVELDRYSWIVSGSKEEPQRE